MDTLVEMDSALADLRPLLMKLARLQLRNDAWAEDAVSETMVAAIEQKRRFEGRSKFQTWVIGILKHKITDQLRRRSREVSVEAQAEAGEVETFDELYTQDGRRLNAPLDWGDPAALLSTRQFMTMLQACVDELPASLGRVFLLREWMEYDTAEICKELGITVTNCHVMLFRARMRLRECVELNWFAGRSAREEPLGDDPVPKRPSADLRRHGPPA
jgi:RNA polymerase sigma-70 factor (ECF subfamily)